MISVVVPTRGNQDLEDCLKSLKKQAKKSGEIIIVFDRKADKNVKTAKNYGARKVFDKNGTIGGAYSTGAKAAKGEIIAFIDDDCIAPKDWIKNIEKEFEEDIDVVSGEDLLPSNATFFQRAAYQVDKARIMGNTVYGEKAKNRLRAANIAYRKNVFEKENFNPRLKGLQEPEFHHRLFKKGFKMKFNPKLYVYHKRRNSLGDIFNQIYRNGKAKIELLKVHKDMFSVIDIIPPIYIFLLAITTYFAINLNYWFFVYALLLLTAAYFLIKPLYLVIITREIKYYPYLIIIVFIRELGYFLGILTGLLGVFKR